MKMKKNYLLNNGIKFFILSSLLFQGACTSLNTSSSENPYRLSTVTASGTGEIIDLSLSKDSIRRVFPISRGKINGVYREFYSTGIIKEEICFVKGQKYGVAKKFYEDGTLKLEGNFIKNQPFGDFKRFAL